MSGLSPSSVMRDLVDCETKEDLSRLISLLHATLDSECESCITKTKIDSTIVILLETDAILAALTTKFDATIVQFTWKRLISFVKLYHALISSELIIKVTEALNCRAYEFIDALCALAWRKNHRSEDQFPDYASVVSCMQPLIFFSQRISAVLAYFPSYLSDAPYQRSMDVLFFLRGYLSMLESHPSHLQENMAFDKSDLIRRSEEYFWKALHPPLSASLKELEGGTSSQRNGQKRSRNDPGDVNKGISAERSSYGHLTPLEKFYLCARSSGSTSSSGYVNIDPKPGGSLIGCMISIGICFLASYEIQKLSDQIKTCSSASNNDNAERGILLTSPDNVSQLQTNPLIFILRIFLSSADRVLFLYNSVCSDKYFTDSLRRFKEAILDYLESTYVSIHTSKGKAAAVSDALLSSLITKACEGATNNFTTSRVARNLLCGIVSCMSNTSQSKVGEILYGMYLKISCTNSENDDIVGGHATESNHTENDGYSDSSVDRTVGVRMHHGSHVGHLRAIALTIRHYLSTMKLSTVHTFLLKIKELSDLASSSHHSVQSADVDRHVVRKSSVNMELLLHAIPFTILLKRCRDENAALGSLSVSGQKVHPQGTLFDLLSGLLVGSLSQVNQTERDITSTRLKGSNAISQGAVIGVTVLSNLYSNRNDSFMTSNSAKDITLAVQAAITHKSPMLSLAALKSSLLVSISAISKYFQGLSANSAKGSSMRTSAQYRKVIGCLNALLRLTKALGAILETAHGLPTEDYAKQQQQQQSGQRDRLSRTLVELTASDVNILTSCASAALLVLDILAPSWTTCHDTLCMSSILKSVKCVCKIILVYVNFAPKEIFEASRSSFPSMISTALALSRAYQVAVDPSQELHCVTAMHLHTGMKIACMWSLILSCLVTFAKKLPPSLQPSVPSLVPQKALILVQAASRGSSGSISRIIDEKNTPTTSGPLVILTDGQKIAVSNILWKEFCSNSKQLAMFDVYKNKFKVKKTGGGHDAELHGPPRMHMSETSLSISFIHKRDGENVSTSQGDGIRMLPHILQGFPPTPLYSSFSASFLSPSLLDSNVIPVVQAVLVGGNDKIEIISELNTDAEAGQSVDNPASIWPVRGSCSYALLVLPASNSAALGNNVLLRSTDSFAVLHLTEQTSKVYANKLEKRD